MHILSTSEVQQDTKRWLGDALINDIIGSNVTNREKCHQPLNHIEVKTLKQIMLWISSFVTDS